MMPSLALTPLDMLLFLFRLGLENVKDEGASMISCYARFFCKWQLILLMSKVIRTGISQLAAVDRLSSYLVSYPLLRSFRLLLPITAIVLLSTFSNLYPPTFPFLSKSFFCKFRVMLGSLTTNPSNSFDILTWHPSRLVSVSPNARSNMSFSSSSGSGILLYMDISSTMTWHVEQAHEPPQAPSISKSCACAMSRRLSPAATVKGCDWRDWSRIVT